METIDLLTSIPRSVTIYDINTEQKRTISLEVPAPEDKIAWNMTSPTVFHDRQLMWFTTQGQGLESFTLLNVLNVDTGVHVKYRIPGNHDVIAPQADGQMIVWQGAFIYLYDLQTQQLKQLSDGQGNCYCPTIANGRVAWQSDKEGNYNIYLYDLQTGEIQSMFHAQFKPQAPKAGVQPEAEVASEGEAVEFPFDELEAEVRAHIAHMSPLEAAQYLFYNAAPPLNHLLFEVLDKAIRDNPKSVQSLILRGDAYRRLEEDFESARKDFARAVEVAPQSGEARQKLGQILVMLGKNDEAIVELTKAMDLGYDNSTTQVLLGYAYKEKEEFKKALEHFRKALEYNPYSRTAQINTTILESKVPADPGR
ncbi:tetratricopeptide repeat protein [Candidatus Poribacteria bacterium]|nr:tetratricopeptide repeat protein [Candidatus Poribacteria bacterium]